MMMMINDEDDRDDDRDSDSVMMMMAMMLMMMISYFYTKVGVKELMRVYELLGEHYTEVFSCPANSSIGDLVTHSLTHSLRDLLKNTTTDLPQRLVTFETFNQSDERI